ncbi:MAG: MGMT family protein [Flectobacillus sp.]|nr:MGMT family protein [Flectobacillus sp.]
MDTNRFDDVYQVVRLIPSGRVTSYGAIASYLGTKGGARLVGWAMNASHTDSNIPAHRVVNRNGVLTGKAHFGGNRMEELLRQEGILVSDDKVVDFDQLFWNPAVELLH